MVKNLPAAQKTWVGKILWKRKWLSTPVFMDRRAPVGYSPWGCKKLDTTEQLTHTHTDGWPCCLHVRINSDVRVHHSLIPNPLSVYLRVATDKV